jgi:hypothetical protein
MMFFHHRQNMVRYIIQIYAPLSLFAGIGFEYITSRFTKNKLFIYGLFFLLVIYSLLTLAKVTPFYLEYYNELVGGTKTVHDKKLFFIGWFGEGLKEPSIYIADHAPKNAKVGLAINPFTFSSVYRVSNLRYEQFTPLHQYDYVMVNYYQVIRMQFDENSLKKDYKLVYTEHAAGIDFVHVYKHR